MYHLAASDHICGCYFQIVRPDFYGYERYYLPQAELESYTKITPVSFSTTLKQTFTNPYDKTIEELRYTFPLYDGVSVSAYTIQYADQVLEGVVKLKEAARATYRAAVDRGETAGLLESLPAGVFGVTIGNLPAKTDVFVNIVYAGELKHDAGIDGLRYTLPTAIAPRYGEYPGEVLKSNVTGKGIKITVDIDMGKSAIRKVQSPTHPIAVTMGNLSTNSTSTTFSPSLGSAALTQGSTELGDDFVLQLLIDDISKPQAIIEKHASLDSRAIMATVVPQFNLPLATPEIVFIADQSGSMGGSKNTELVAALHIFLKSLPFGVRFNICAFGSTYNYLWAKSQPYNEENLKAAADFVNTFNAQWGGTEMYEPVKQAFLRRHGDLPLEIMLLTDGEIWQEQQLFDLINEKIFTDGVDARVFTLGIGSDVSHTLCEGIARAGNGFAQFVVEDEETDAKTLRMLRASLFPHTKDYSLEINFDDRDDSSDDFELVEKLNDSLQIEDVSSTPKAIKSVLSFFTDKKEPEAPIQNTDRFAHLPKIAIPNILQAPSRIPPLFPYNRANLYFLLGPDAPKKQVVSVTIRATSPHGPLELTIPVHANDSPGTVVHQLAARKAVQELEDGRGWIHEGKTAKGVAVKKHYASRLDELAEREGIRLGETYQIASRWCSFVAVGGNAREESDDSQSLSVESMRAAPRRAGLFGSKPAMASTFSSKKKRMAAGSPMYLSAGAPAPAIPPPPPAAPAPAGEYASARYSPAFGGQFAPMAAARGQFFADKDEDEEDGAVDIQLLSASEPAPPGGAGLEQRAVDTSNPAAVLRAVINLQTFSGSWKWEDELLGLINAKTASSNGLTPDGASATALVLAFFEKKMAAQRDVWQMIAEKARSWLQSQASAGGVDQLIEKAAKSLP